MPVQTRGSFEVRQRNWAQFVFVREAASRAHAIFAQAYLGGSVRAHNSCLRIFAAGPLHVHRLCSDSDLDVFVFEPGQVMILGG